MAKLTEGMRAGDLKDLVLPMISVDEYESKVDPDAVVLGFYVHDKDAASDLNRFAQKSAIPLLDTEVAPAPDQHGYYLVFVELLCNDRMPGCVKRLLDEIGPLAGIEAWQMRVRKAGGPVEFSPKDLASALDTARKQDVKENELRDFLRPSGLHDLIISGDELIMEGLSSRTEFTVAGFGPDERVLRAAGLMDAALCLSPEAFTRTRRIARLLGEGWDVQMLRGGQVIVRREGIDACLILVDRAF